MVDRPVHSIVAIVRVESEVSQCDGEVLDWRQTVRGPGGETVGTRHVPVAQSDQGHGVGGGLNRTTAVKLTELVEIIIVTRFGWREGGKDEGEGGDGGWYIAFKVKLMWVGGWQGDCRNKVNLANM